jgi:hypothetical protein
MAAAAAAAFAAAADKPAHPAQPLSAPRPGAGGGGLATTLSNTSLNTSFSLPKALPSGQLFEEGRLLQHYLAQTSSPLATIGSGGLGPATAGHAVRGVAPRASALATRGASGAAAAAADLLLCSQCCCCRCCDAWACPGGPPLPAAC